MAAQNSQQITTVVAIVMIVGITFGFLFFTHNFLLFPILPSFYLAGFSVSNVNASYPGFTSNWEANVTVYNNNLLLKTYIGEIKTHVYYEEDYLLASADVQPFSVKTMRSKMIHTEITATDEKLGKMGPWAVQKIAEERRTKGSATFNLRISFSAKLKLGSWRRLHGKNKEVNCGQVKILLGSSSSGDYVSRDRRRCKYVRSLI